LLAGRFVAAENVSLAFSPHQKAPRIGLAPFSFPHIDSIPDTEGEEGTFMNEYNFRTRKFYPCSRMTTALKVIRN